MFNTLSIESIVARLQFLFCYFPLLLHLYGGNSNVWYMIWCLHSVCGSKYKIQLQPLSFLKKRLPFSLSLSLLPFVSNCLSFGLLYAELHSVYCCDIHITGKMKWWREKLEPILWKREGRRFLHIPCKQEKNQRSNEDNVNEILLS